VLAVSGRMALIGMIVGVVICAAAAAGSTAGAKPAPKRHARCAKASKSKMKQVKGRAKCPKQPAGPLAEVTSLLRGIPEEHETLGNPHAPVTLVMYGDLECPACRYSSYFTLPTLIKEFVRPGKLKIEYHSFQSATIEPSIFQEQQVAALAAGQQDKMWYFVELFYHEQGREYTNYVNESYLDGLARQVPGLNLTEWMAARSDTQLAAQVEQDEQFGTSYEWETTPDFLLSEGNKLGPFHPESAAPSSFAKVIKERLAVAGG
jgi:protein-disulfide isomerase